jgi:hypothetical protein
MPFLTDLLTVKSQLLLCPTFVSKYDDVSDAEDHIYLFRMGFHNLEDGKPHVVLNHGSRWSRDIQSHHGGENLYRTTSSIILHFEQRLPDDLKLNTVSKISEEMETFVDWIGGVFCELEDLSEYLIMSYGPESTDTPNISNIEEVDGDYVSYRVEVNAN